MTYREPRKIPCVELAGGLSYRAARGSLPRTHRRFRVTTGEPNDPGGAVCRPDLPPSGGFPLPTGESRPPAMEATEESPGVYLVNVEYT